MPRISVNAFNLGIPGGVLFIQFYEHRRPVTRSQSSASIAKMASGTSTTPPRQRESGRTALPGRPRPARGWPALPYGAGRGGRRSYGRGSRVCPDSRRRARCRSRGGHQIVVAPRVRCALAGLVLTVAVAADSVSAALWSLTCAGWLPVPGVAQPGPQGARRTTGSKPHACWQGGERPGRSRTVPMAATRQDPRQGCARRGACRPDLG